MTLLRLQSRSLLILTKHQTALVSSRALPLKQVLRPLCINTVKPFPTSTLRHFQKTGLVLQRTLISTRSEILKREDLNSGTPQKKKELKEDIYTIPNVLTFGRLLAAPYIGHLILHNDYNQALGLFVLAGFTDLLDGYIARKYNMKTLLGTIIDPAADKVLMTVMTITLAMEGVLPVPLAAVILGRDVGLVISAFYYRYISLPEPKTISRYFDGSIPSAEVRPTQISKINTALQLALMGFSLTSVSMDVPSPEALTALQWIVGGTTVWSGASYIFSKDAVRILK